DGIQVVSSNGALISGNRMNRVGSHGILVQESNHVDVFTNVIGDGIYSGAGIDGIHVSGGESVEIDGNIIQGGLLGANGAGNDGIHVVNNRQASITDNVIQAGLLSAEGAGNHGIYVENSGAKFTGFWDALFNQGRRGVIVTGNTISGILSDGAGDDGIHVVNSGGG